MKMILRCLVLLIVTPVIVVGDEPTTIGSRLELFTDDTLISELKGEVRLELQKPTRQEVALQTDVPWEGNACHFRSVFRDDSLYRMYYGSYQYTTGGAASEALETHPAYVCYAESDDGIHWQRPNLGIVDFNGSKDNNIVIAADMFPEIPLDPAHVAVFRDANPDCPPESRYKIMMLGTKPRGIYVLKSSDAIHFSLASTTPILTKGAFDSQNLAFWDPIRNEYREYHRGYRERIRGIMTSTSSDFVHWTEPTWVEYGDAPSAHLYTNQIQPYFRAPHIFVGFPMRYSDRGWSDSMFALPGLQERLARASHSKRYGTAVTDGLFMSSRDGVNFKRFSEAFLRPGPRKKDSWVYGDNSVAWGIVPTTSSLADAPDEISLYATEGYWTETSLNVRRYTLRQDGFVSVNASYSGGELLTRPIVFDGGNLVLNFETSGAGSVRVEMQDADGAPIAGYTLDDCPPQFGDDIAHTIRWKNGGDVRSLAGRPVRLRFVLQDADLYSYRFTPFEPDPVRPDVK